MPKTRRKRTEQTSKQDQDISKSELDNNMENMTDKELRAELQSELKRLQDEYKHQRDLTAELERKRSDIQLGFKPVGEPTLDSTRPEQVEVHMPHIHLQESETSETVKEPYKHADFHSDQPIGSQTFLSDIDIDRRFSGSINSIKTELTELKDKLESKLDKEAINDLKIIQSKIDDLSTSLNNFNKEVQRLHKNVARTEEKLDDVLLDLGFEESIDINKIPNYILVLVYETILNDIINRIKHVLGTQDTETAVRKILENVRSHTSGGELFKYEHNKIKIPELRQYLDKKMISPKQIHITFNSIINQLLEYSSGYVPKNFKAMIKIKSQEYAVDMVDRLEERLVNLNNELGEVKNNINHFLLKYKDRMVTQQIYQEEMKNLNIQISKLTERIDTLPDNIDVSIENKIEKVLNEKFNRKSHEKALLNIEKDKEKDSLAKSKQKEKKSEKNDDEIMELEKKDAKDVKDSDDDNKKEEIDVQGKVENAKEKLNINNDRNSGIKISGGVIIIEDTIEESEKSKQSGEEKREEKKEQKREQKNK